MIMKENFDIYDFDVVCDIESECEEVYDAKSFVNHIEENYKQEIDDVDDMPLVYIGICVALKKRNIQVPDELKQLIPTLLKNKNFIKRLGENESYLKSFKKWRTKFLKTLDNDEYNNVNIKYVSPFINWRENDIYMINVEETSEKERYVFLRVVEKKEENGKYYPIVYLFFMPGFSSNFSVDIENVLIKGDKK